MSAVEARNNKGEKMLINEELTSEQKKAVRQHVDNWVIHVLENDRDVDGNIVSADGFVVETVDEFLTDIYGPSKGKGRIYE